MTEPTSSPWPHQPEEDDNRRAAIRCGCRIRASCDPISEKAPEQLPGEIENLSETGMGLVVGHRFTPGAILSVTMRSPSGGILDTVRVRVVWVRPRRDDAWLHGCHVIGGAG